MSTLPARDQRFSTTLAHGLQLLCSFRVSEVALGNRQFAERTGLSKATVSRLTYTLAELGYLKLDLELRKYRLGAAALAVSYPLLAGLRVRQAARPLMRELANASKGSVSLGMRDRTRMIYVESSRGHHALTFRPDIGASLPILQSAMGRAWAAQAPATEASALLSQIQSEDPIGWKTFGARFRRSVRDFESLGFCVSHGDWRSEVHAVAVPIRVPIDGETLVFNCGVTALQLGRRSIEVDIGPRLVAMTRAVEKLMQPHQ